METKGMGSITFLENETPTPLRVTEPCINWNIDDGLINAVVTAAVWSAGQQPGVWGKMMTALNKGVKETKEETLEVFFFHAMVDRLLEEFHSLEPLSEH